MIVGSSGTRVAHSKWEEHRAYEGFWATAFGCGGMKVTEVKEEREQGGVSRI